MNFQLCELKPVYVLCECLRSLWPHLCTYTPAITTQAREKTVQETMKQLVAYRERKWKFSAFFYIH